MTDYAADTYGDAVANAYGDLYGDFQPGSDQIAILAELAGAGIAVEVGSGDGRVALPLAEHGVRVVGVDASAQMTRVLAERAQQMGVPVTALHADAAAFVIGEPVDLVFAVFNTFFLLGSEAAQRGFLGQAVRALGPDGRVVIEVFVPRAGRLPDGPHPGVFPEESVVVVKQRRTDRLVLFAATNTPADQRFDYHEVVLADGQVPRLYPGSMRYCWPKDVDVMADEAGLALESRWAGWDRRSFTDDSPKHVSVYRPV